MLPSCVQVTHCLVPEVDLDLKVPHFAELIIIPGEGIRTLGKRGGRERSKHSIVHSDTLVANKTRVFNARTLTMLDSRQGCKT